MQNKSNQLRRRLNALGFKLESALEQSHGAFNDEVKILIGEIQKLVKLLSSSFSRRRLRRMLGAMAFIVGLGPLGAFAQNQFNAPVTDPFGIAAPSTAIPFPRFVDIDGDGDMDLFVGSLSEYYGGAKISFLENIGDAQNPEFAAAVSEPFGVEGADQYAVPGFADLDEDGDMDLFIGEYYGGLKYYENIGDAQNPEFGDVQQNPFGIEMNEDFVHVPRFIDIDADGDLDLIGLSFNYVSYTVGLSLFINVSDDQNGIAFVEGDLSLHNLDQVSSEYGRIPDFADMDGDGDLDLIVGEYYGNITFYDNIAEAGDAALFGEPVMNPFDFDSGEIEFELLIPALVDIDADGDIDLFAVGDYGDYGAVHFFENVLISSTDKEPIASESLKVYPNPVSGGYLDVEIDQEMERVVLISTLGKELNLSLKGSRVNLPDDLSPGHYILKVEMKNGQVEYENLIKN